VPAASGAHAQHGKKVFELVDSGRFDGRSHYKDRDGELLDCNGYMEGPIETVRPVDVPSVLTLIKTVQSLRGQMWRFARVQFEGHAAPNIFRALTAAVGGLSHFITLQDGEAIVLYKMDKPDRTRLFEFTPDLFLLLRNPVLEHAALMGPGGAGAKVLQVMRSMAADGKFRGGSMRLAAEDDNSRCLSYARALEEVKNYTLEQWRESKCEAQKAKKLKHENPLQMAINVMTGLNEFIMERAKCDALIFNTFPSATQLQVGNYPAGISEAMKNLVGYSWDITFKRIVKHTFKDYLETDLHLLKSAFFLGEGGSGKSTLLHQLCKRFGVMYEKETYIFTKALDPLGTLSKSGHVLQAAAIAITDFTPVSQNGVPLDSEGLKSLCDVQEGGSFPARYSVAVLPAETPRMFALNADANSNWFDKNGMPELGALMKRDAETLRTANSDIQAQARRIIVFMCPNEILMAEGRKALSDRTQLKASEGLRRLTVATTAAAPEPEEAIPARVLGAPLM
jgi:hypothetical protein